MADDVPVASSTTAPHGEQSSVLAAARRAVPETMWISPLMDPSGHADEVRGFLRALERHGYKPAAREYRWTDAEAGLTTAERAQLARQTERTPAEPFVV